MQEPTTCPICGGELQLELVEGHAELSCVSCDYVWVESDEEICE